jgi:antitoxin (DNA-binding transcriptional repressor) of toxin-antitoxin stability system
MGKQKKLTKNGKRVAKLTSTRQNKMASAKALFGILPSDVDLDSAYAPPPDPIRNTGFLKGRVEVPEDFDSMGNEEIQAMFGSVE